MPVIVIKAVGGLLMAIYLMSSGAANLERYNSKIQQHKEIVQQEIDELVEDYELFQESYIEHMVKVCIDEYDEITEEDIKEFKGTAIEEYISYEKYHEVDLSNSALRQMERKLPQKAQDRIEYNRGMGKPVNGDIIYSYLRERFEKEQSDGK